MILYTLLNWTLLQRNVMKLYYSPNACSLSAHIVLRECDTTFEMESVDLKNKKTDSGADYLKINPKGYVPALKLDNGQILTEASVIIQYLADTSPQFKLAPALGTFERYRLQEWLSFIATEIHKGLGVFFIPNLPEEFKKIAMGNIQRKLDYLEKHLSKHAMLLDDTFTVADAYLFTILRWTHYFKMDLTPWPSLPKYMETIAQRPAVQAALKAEASHNGN